MDELQISGKRFISSRRVAKENGYHTDYIGQLIRGGKIKGQKVGRAWYVEASSLAEFLGTESAPALVEASVEQVPEVPAAPVVQTPSMVEQAEKKEITVPVAEKIEEVKVEIAAEPIPETKVVINKEEKKVLPHISAGLKYLADDEPLLPEIAPKEDAPRAVPVSAAVFEDIQPEPEVSIIEHRPRAAKTLFGLALVGAAVFVFSAVVSSTLFQTINIEAGNSANVSYGIKW